MIAAALLRAAGANVEFRVKRKKVTPPRDLAAVYVAAGRTLFRSDSYRAARDKLKATRVAQNDVVSIQMVAAVRERNGAFEHRETTPEKNRNELST
jgi:hypothetical protein